MAIHPVVTKRLLRGFWSVSDQILTSTNTYGTCVRRRSPPHHQNPLRSRDLGESTTRRKTEVFLVVEWHLSNTLPVRKFTLLGLHMLKANFMKSSQHQVGTLRPNSSTMSNGQRVLNLLRDILWVPRTNIKNQTYTVPFRSTWTVFVNIYFVGLTEKLTEQVTSWHCLPSALILMQQKLSSHKTELIIFEWSIMQECAFILFPCLALESNWMLSLQ